MLIVFDVLVIGAALMLLGLVVYSRFSVKSMFWPPPNDHSWKRFATLSLFRTMFYGLVAISIYRAMNGGMQPSIWLFPAAVFLTVFGIGTAVVATLVLGWTNAFGAKNGLKTTGLFALSRNPVYLMTWVGQIGWALLVPHPVILLVLLVWGVLYWIAIPLEEQWLESQYGDEFAGYSSKTPRYF